MRRGSQEGRRHRARSRGSPENVQQRTRRPCGVRPPVSPAWPPARGSCSVRARSAQRARGPRQGARSTGSDGTRRGGGAPPPRVPHGMSECDVRSLPVQEMWGLKGDSLGFRKDAGHSGELRAPLGDVQGQEPSGDSRSAELEDTEHRETELAGVCARGSHTLGFKTQFLVSRFGLSPARMSTEWLKMITGSGGSTRRGRSPRRKAPWQAGQRTAPTGRQATPQPLCSPAPEDSTPRLCPSCPPALTLPACVSTVRRTSEGLAVHVPGSPFPALLRSRMSERQLLDAAGGQENRDTHQGERPPLPIRTLGAGSKAGEHPGSPFWEGGRIHPSRVSARVLQGTDQEDTCVCVRVCTHN